MHFWDLLLYQEWFVNRIFDHLYRTHLFLTQATTVHEISHKQQQQRELVSSKDQINVIRVYLMGN